MDKLEDFEPLQPAEEKLRAAAVKGQWAKIAEERPEEDGRTEDNAIRAEFIRYIALGGCETCKLHPKGLRLKGAWIDGDIDLEGCTLLFGLNLHRCWIEGPINLREARAQRLDLEGSCLSQSDVNGDALDGQGLKTTGAVLLRRGFRAQGGVRLYGAEIGGALDCDGAELENDKGWALDAEGATVKGAVMLRNGFRAKGGVRLYGAEIGGDLACDGAELGNGKGWALDAPKAVVKSAVLLRNGFRAKGGVRLFGAEIGGNLDCHAGRFENPTGGALLLYGARIGGSLVMFEQPSENGAPVEMFDGRLDLRDAQIGRLFDAEACWPAAGRLLLDGCVYGGFTQTAPTDWRARLRWLKRQWPEHRRGDFRPQPWEQLEKTLMAQGKVYDAKRIGVEKEKALAHTLPWFTRPFHWLHGVIAGYGYFTARAAWISIVMVILGTVLFAQGWRDGVMVPAEEVLLDDPQWLSCAEYEVPTETTPTAAECWTAQKPGSDYVSFNSFLYSFDVFIPIVSIELEPAWTPSSARGPEVALPWLGEASLGYWLSIYRIFHEVMGYVLSGFLVLGAARLVREGGAR